MHRVDRTIVVASDVVATIHIVHSTWYEYVLVKYILSIYIMNKKQLVVVEKKIK